jgi:primosomal protein N' (replication factor Y)
VLVPTPSERPYTYAVPEGMEVEPGRSSQVPLGPRMVAGVVWDAEAEGRGRSEQAARDHQVFDCPPLPEEMRRFIDWVARYTLSAPGMVARMVLRSPAAFDPEPPMLGIALRTDVVPERLTAARERVLEMATGCLGWTRSGLAHAAGVSLSVIDGLTKAGVFEEIELPPVPVVAQPDPDYGRRNCLGIRRQPRRR